MDNSPTRPLRRRRTVWLVAIYAAWISAGALPLLAAHRGARAPSDFLRDYVAAVALSRGELLSALDGPRGNAEVSRMGEEPVNIINGSPFHLHPPPAALPTRLFVPLGFRTASAALLAVSIALLGVLAHVLVAVAERLGCPAPAGRTRLFLLLVIWPPTLTNLELGQWSILLATLVALGFDSWDRGAQSRGAAWLAGAAALKLTPGLFFGFVALRNRRAAAVFAAVVLVAAAIALPFGGGMDAWLAFQRDAGKNVAEWQGWWHNTLSINGLVARLFLKTIIARPLMVAPTVARALVLLAAVLLVGTAFVATRAGRQIRSQAHEGCVFATWSIAIVLLNPLAWTHYALFLLLPASLVWRAANAPNSGLSEVPRARLRGAVGIAIVMLSVPKETICLLVLPFPASPLAAPLLSLHALAALLLFTAAAVAARWTARAVHA